MRVAHLSDLHLGFRAFSTVERGWNLRERDVAAAFHAAIQEIGRLRPDLVLLTGDLFDRPNPPSTAFLTLTRGIRTLQETLPDIVILALAGERDTPRTPADPGPVAVLDAIPGVEAAAGAPRSVHLQELDTHALLVPHRAVIRPPFPQLRPDPAARWNLLLVRGEPGGSEGDLVLDPTGWDYVALSGGHEARIWDAPAGRVRSAGALERIGADPWREGTAEKGFWTFDLASGAGEFHPIPGRPVIDLAPVQVDPEDPQEGTRRLRDLLQGLPGGVNGKILRVRLQGRGPDPVAGVSPGLLDAVRRRTAHLEIQSRPAKGRLPRILVGRGSSADAGPIRVSWRPVHGGEAGAHVALTPGLWGVLAEGEEDRRRLGECLDGPSREDPRMLSLVLSGIPRVDRFRFGGSSALGTREPDPGRAAGAEGGVGAAEELQPSPRPSVPSGSPAGPIVRLRELRADWIEAVGDSEALSLEWVQERQEAESRLVQYRDRARDLRNRLRSLAEQGVDSPCPTCRRPLEDAHGSLVERLREEWEDVVQDGSWWRRRREQLEEKPRALRDLDRRILEIQARMEAEVRPPPGSGVPPTEGQTPTATETGAAKAAQVPPDPEGPGPVSGEGTEEVIAVAADFLSRVTDGRIRGLALAKGGRGVWIRDSRDELQPPTVGDLPLVSAALALADFALEPGAVPRGGETMAEGDRSGPDRTGPAPGLLLPQFAGSEGTDEVVRFLELLSAEPLPVPVVVVLAPALAERLPERFVGTLDFYRDAEGRARLRVDGAGRPAVHLRSP